MSIVKMSRLTLVAMNADKQQLLDEMVKSGSVQIGECEQLETPNVDSVALEKLCEDVDYLKRVAQVITTTVDKTNNSLPKDARVQIPAPSSAYPRYEYSFDDFKNFAKKQDEVFALSAKILEKQEEANSALAEKARIDAELATLKIFLPLEIKPEFFADTAHTYVALGVMPRENYDILARDWENEELVGLEKLNETSTEALVGIYCHKSLSSLWEGLSKYGFRRADVTGNVLPRVTYAEKQAIANSYVSKAQCAMDEIVKQADLVKDLQMVSDLISLSIKEMEAGKGMNDYGYTFAMSAYVPTEETENVQTALTNVTQNVIVQFDEIGDDEPAPTLCKNNKLVTPFESVTNMYMPPNYHEPDPNPLMSIFYFLIFGLMTADVGYGLLLAVAGLLFGRSIKQRTGLKQLATLIGICGFGTIFWGFLFGSCFSMDMTPWLGESARSWYPILPSPSGFPIVTMALSLVLGILHIMTGLVSNAMKQIKQHKVADAIIDNLPWFVFFVGLMILLAWYACGKDMICSASYLQAIENGKAYMQAVNSGATSAELATMLEGFNGNIITQTHLQALDTFSKSAVYGKLMNIGLYILAGALVIVAVTAGRHNKGLFGKLKGGFGGVYGTINYFSDVISYVRIFGLMLSGAVFGAIINQIVSEMLFPIGIPGYVFGAVILVLFHVFNLALAVLGAYVHNARLQYVEYFGKFFDGEGSLFTPLGSDLEHTYITH